MKFSRCFQQWQCPEWEPFYINYNAIKKLFKAASIRAQQQGDNADFNELSAALSHDIGKVEAFYVSQYGIIQRKVALLYSCYGVSDATTVDNLSHVDRHEIEDALSSFVELLQTLGKIQWYGKLNRDAFRRILGKVDKTTSSCNPLVHKLESFQDCLFTNQKQCLGDIERVNMSISNLTDASKRSQTDAIHTSLLLQNFYILFYPRFDSLDTTYQAIVRDDILALYGIIGRQCCNEDEQSSNKRSYLLVLLQCSVLQGSRQCIEKLLSQIGSLKDDTLPGGCNCLHLVIISLGRRQMTHDRQHRSGHLKSSAEPKSVDEEYHSLFSYIIDLLRPDQLHALVEMDSFGSLPLHYAAAYGLTNVCEKYLKYTQDQSEDPGIILTRNMEGYTPLHLSVIGDHHDTTRLLLEHRKKQYGTVLVAEDEVFQSMLGELLIIAIKSNFAAIARTLMKCCDHLNYQNSSGETALYVAARNGLDDYVEALLMPSASCRIDVDLPEKLCGWTPLFISCIRGHLSVVKQLLKAGANPGICDFSGWTVREHAAFRGHLGIMSWLATTGAANTISEARTVLQGSPLMRGIPTVEKIASQLTLGAIQQRSSSKNTESHIFVTLGSLNTRSHARMVDLDPYISLQASPVTPATGYSLHISAIGASGSTHVVDVPMLHDMTNEPWVFTTKDPGKVQLMFNIFRLTEESNKRGVLIGSGIALLKNLKQESTSNCESLVRDYTTSILRKESFDLLGTVTFSFLVVTPFPHQNFTISQRYGFLEKEGPTQVVGHRGLGANSTAHTNLQIGENTVQSFLTAAALGASCVEFDVQLTKDLNPVIFHDFLVMETGGDIPLHTLSLDQFIHLGKAQSPRSDLPGMAEARHLERSKSQVDRRHKPRSRSLNSFDDYRSDDLEIRMRQTIEGRNEIKGNLRGHSIQELYPTFDDLLNLPESVAFDLEMKYPMLWEAEDRDMEPYAIEANRFVDIVLDKIYRHGGKRNITFSSFSPEMCIILSRKQHDYPILFISKSGSIPVGDIRASCLQQSIRFARSWGLAGIVMLSDPFVMCPRLVQYVKDSGLVCCSYGPLNNDPKNAMVRSYPPNLQRANASKRTVFADAGDVQIQTDAGLDASIVDKFHLISKTLARARSDLS